MPGTICPLKCLVLNKKQLSRSRGYFIRTCYGRFAKSQVSPTSTLLQRSWVVSPPFRQRPQVSSRRTQCVGELAVGKTTLWRNNLLAHRNVRKIVFALLSIFSCHTATKKDKKASRGDQGNSWLSRVRLPWVVIVACLVWFSITIADR